MHQHLKEWHATIGGAIDNKTIRRVAWDLVTKGTKGWLHESVELYREHMHEPDPHRTYYIAPCREGTNYLYHVDIAVAKTEGGIVDKYEYWFDLRGR